jgi:competence ComEA-like helix-hairpin-helix protein
MLDGIGDVIGGRIVDYREENGAFASVDELIEVKGIGEKTLEKIRERVVCLTEE